jgi:CTD small phosphatase-like protein 2
VRRYESDLIVLLDMDECLIHADFKSQSAAQLYAHQLLPSEQQQQVQQQQQQEKDGTNSRAPATVESFPITLRDRVVPINLRPGLREFLCRVTQRFETHVFTAAGKSYADLVLNHLDPKGLLFAGRWYRDSCMEIVNRIRVKPILRLPIFSDRGATTAWDGSPHNEQHPALRRVVLVDNNPMSFLANPDNGILVESFTNNPCDRDLETVWHLLRELEGVDDVRPHLKSRFGLRQMLAVPLQLFSDFGQDSHCPPPQLGQQDKGKALEASAG